jgi:hypothetical protein
MALFGRGYDRDYDREYSRRSSFERGGRGMWGNPAYGGYDAGYGASRRLNQPGIGYGAEYGASRPSYRPEGGYDWQYDRPYKSRWQTDYGDPFGDREQQTPFRVIRGEGGHPGGRGFRAAEYGGDYRRTPAGYWMYDRAYRGGAPRYDNDWF